MPDESKSFWGKLLENVPLILVLLGVVLFVVGAAGALPMGEKQLLPVVGTAWRIAVAMLGLTLAGGGLFFFLRSVNYNPDRQGPNLGPTSVPDPDPKAIPIPIPRTSPQYDVFLAVPMAAFGNDKDFQDSRQMVLNFITELEERCGVKDVYYAGKKISSVQGFEAFQVAAKVDLEALQKSRYFVMIYPKEIVSSVLFEAGYALALGKNSIYFVHNESDLPYLMRQSEALPHPPFPDVNIHVYKDIDDLMSILRRNKANIFPWPRAA